MTEVHIKMPDRIQSAIAIYLTHEQILASNYAFRMEQNRVSALNNFGTIVDTSSGAVHVGNFVIVGMRSRAGAGPAPKGHSAKILRTHADLKIFIDRRCIAEPGKR